MFLRAAQTVNSKAKGWPTATTNFVHAGVPHMRVPTTNCELICSSLAPQEVSLSVIPWLPWPQPAQLFTESSRLGPEARRPPALQAFAQPLLQQVSICQCSCCQVVFQSGTMLCAALPSCASAGAGGLPRRGWVGGLTWSRHMPGYSCRPDPFLPLLRALLTENERLGLHCASARRHVRTCGAPSSLWPPQISPS